MTDPVANEDAQQPRAEDFPAVTPRDLYPTSDIRFVLIEIAKLTTKVERLIDDVNSNGKEIDGLRDKIDGRIDGLRDKIDKLKTGLSAAKIWALILYFGLGASLLGVMAKGFKWL